RTPTPSPTNTPAITGSPVNTNSPTPMPTLTPTPTLPPGCRPVWAIVPSPNEGNYYNWLRAVAVIAPDDIWAVGTYQNGAWDTLVLHWNGNNWTRIASPNPGTGYNRLQGAAGSAADDVWAVGYFSSTTGSYQPLIEHWDGTQWSIVPAPP